MPVEIVELFAKLNPEVDDRSAVTAGSCALVAHLGFDPVKTAVRRRTYFPTSRSYIGRTILCHNSTRSLIAPTRHRSPNLRFLQHRMDQPFGELRQRGEIAPGPSPRPSIERRFSQYLLHFDWADEMWNRDKRRSRPSKLG